MHNFLSWKHIVAPTFPYDKTFGKSNAIQSEYLGYAFMFIIIILVVIGIIRYSIILKQNGYTGKTRRQLMLRRCTTYVLFGMLTLVMTVSLLSRERTHVQHTNTYLMQDGIVKEYKLTNNMPGVKSEYVYKVYDNKYQLNGLSKLKYLTSYTTNYKIVPSNKLFAFKEIK